MDHWAHSRLNFLTNAALGGERGDCASIETQPELAADDAPAQLSFRGLCERRRGKRSGSGGSR